MRDSLVLMLVTGAFFAGAPYVGLCASDSDSAAASASRDPDAKAWDEALVNDPCPNGDPRPAGGICSMADPSVTDTPQIVATEVPCEGGYARIDGFCPAVTEEIKQFWRDAYIGGGPPKPKRVDWHQPRRIGPSEMLDHVPITFRLGSADLTTRGEAQARTFAAELRKPQFLLRQYEIAGHTDASGDPDVNLKLSQTRADNVRQFLINNGVEATRLRAKGYGQTQLAFPNPLDARNRRVQAVSLN